MTHSGWVDFRDFHEFALSWLDTGCGVPDWCDGADLDESTEVDAADLDILLDDWLIDSI